MSKVKSVTYAVVKDDIKTIRTAIEGGLDVNTRGRDDHTLLGTAVCSIRHAIVRLLLDHSSTDVNARDGSGYTALHRSIQTCGIPEGFEITKMLVLAKADVNVQITSSLWTPLHLITCFDDSRPQSRFLQCAEFLLAHGAAPSLFVVDCQGKTPVEGVQVASGALLKLYQHGAKYHRLEHQTILMEVMPVRVLAELIVSYLF